MAKAPQTKKAAKPAIKTAAPKNNWEIKDRTYILTSDQTPLTYTIASRHTYKYHCYGLMKLLINKEN